MKKIFLSNGQVSLVSDEDHIFLIGFSWSMNTGYVRGWVNGKCRYIHRLIAERIGLNLTKREIDHIDGDKLNNQRDNLRIATRSQNITGRSILKNNMSGYKGVTKRKNKWQARIRVNGQLICLGLFTEPEEAHQAYCAAAEYYFGEFANP